jgi:hypothetical protein
MNNWKKLCEHIKPLIDRNVGEDELHGSFERWLRDFFNWDGTSLQHEVRVPMGNYQAKRADIVLYGGGFGIVIEMKAPDVSIGNEEIEQLNSYMRILNYKYGFIVGNKLKMFYDDGKPGEMVKEVADIDFVPGNRDGVELGEILDKSVCSDEKLKGYAEKRKGPKKPPGELPSVPPLPPSSDPHTELKKVWTYWNRKYPKYKAEQTYEHSKSGNSWCHIPIDNWPRRQVFYEFVIFGSDPKNILVDFYDEKLPIYDKIKKKLESKEITKIAGEPIIENGSCGHTKNNHGRVGLSIPLSKGPEYVCDRMKELIDKTRDAITETIKQEQ